MTDEGTWLIAGLGNPGRNYQKTRHNVGFMAIDELGANHGIALNRSMFKNLYGRGLISGGKVVLAKPMDYMNRSGPPVYQLSRYFDIKAENILIIHDDMDIDIGRIKIKVKGGHGGHKGVRSIIDALGKNEFTRIRIGIGRPEASVDARGGNDDDPAVTDYVLGQLSKQERHCYESVFDAVRKAVETILEKGTAAAMNSYNRHNGLACQDE